MACGNLHVAVVVALLAMVAMVTGQASPDIPQDILTAAANGDADAEFQVGDAYCPESKLCVEKHKRTAVEWFQKAASKGHSGAELKLGLALIHGHGIAQNLTSGFDWLRKAAEKGLAAAKFRVGLCYYYGRGVERDVKEAVSLFREAAEEGLVEAQLKMSELYLRGRGGVPEDAEQALMWSKKAAEQGQPEAQVNVGTCYYEGKGVDADPQEAIRWWRKAVDLGRAEKNNRVVAVALSNLALGYHYGKGVPEDLEEAARLYGEGARAGDFRGRIYQIMCYFRIWWRRWNGSKSTPSAVAEMNVDEAVASSDPSQPEETLDEPPLKLETESSVQKSLETETQSSEQESPAHHVNDEL